MSCWKGQINIVSTIDTTSLDTHMCNMSAKIQYNGHELNLNSTFMNRPTQESTRN